MNDREFRQRIADLLAKRRGVKREDSKKKPPQSQKFKLKVRRSKAA
jgi:hypothetical protein